MLTVWRCELNVSRKTTVEYSIDRYSFVRKTSVEDDVHVRIQSQVVDKRLCYMEVTWSEAHTEENVIQRIQGRAWDLISESLVHGESSKIAVRFRQSNSHFHKTCFFDFIKILSSSWFNLPIQSTRPNKKFLLSEEKGMKTGCALLTRWLILFFSLPSISQFKFIFGENFPKNESRKTKN